MTPKSMWEILVPTVRPNSGGKKFFTTRFHRTWDARVRAITGGLTIMGPVRGQWVSFDGTLFKERMIPVRILCSEEELGVIMQMTCNQYKQEAVLAYKVSDAVKMYNHPTRRNKS